MVLFGILAAEFSLMHSIIASELGMQRKGFSILGSQTRSENAPVIKRALGCQNVH